MLHGRQTTYFRNGQKRLDVNVVDGKREGPYYEWYDNGQVSLKRHLLSRRTARRGRLLVRHRPALGIYEYYRGKPKGRWIEWDRDGKVILDEDHKGA